MPRCCSAAHYNFEARYYSVARCNSVARYNSVAHCRYEAHCYLTAHYKYEVRCRYAIGTGPSTCAAPNKYGWVYTFAHSTAAYRFAAAKSRNCERFHFLEPKNAADCTNERD